MVIGFRNPLNKTVWNAIREGNELGDLIQPVKELIENGTLPKDTHLIKREKEGYGFDEDYFDFYLIEELSDNDRFEPLIRYLLSVAESPVPKRNLDIAFHQAIIHGAMKNAKIFKDMGGEIEYYAVSDLIDNAEVEMFKFVMTFFNLAEHKEKALKEAQEVLQREIEYLRRCKKLAKAKPRRAKKRMLRYRKENRNLYANLVKNTKKIIELLEAI